MSWKGKGGVFKRPHRQRQVVELAGRDKVLYTAHMELGKEFYLTENSLKFLEPVKGKTFEQDLSTIRCVVPISTNCVRAFWTFMANINDGYTVVGKKHVDIKLDSKAMFPDKEERKKHFVHAAADISGRILDAASTLHGGTQVISTSGLVMHENEIFMEEYEGQTKYGKGTLVITTHGVYFVVKGKGLAFDMPLNLLDGFDAHENTLRIYYFEPSWKDGFDKSSSKNRFFETRLFHHNAEAATNTLKRAYTDSGAKEARDFNELDKYYRSLSREQMTNELFEGKYTDTRKIDEFILMITKRMWGMHTSDHIEEFDKDLVLGTLAGGLPFELISEIDQEDYNLRVKHGDHLSRVLEYQRKSEYLIDDYMKIVCKNLDDDSTEKISKYPIIVIHESLEEIAKNGSLSEDRPLPCSKIFADFVNKANHTLLSNGLPSRKFINKTRMENYWSQKGASSILQDADYKEIFLRIQNLLNEAEPDYDGVMIAPHRTYTQMDYRAHFKASKRRNKRLYDEWCKSNPLPDCTDPRSDEWVKYIEANINMSEVEKIASYFEMDENDVDVIRDAFSTAEAEAGRLERMVVPHNIPKTDIYNDTWHDKGAHMWFTTGTITRKSILKKVMISMDQCEQKYGVRAHAFHNKDVRMRHGKPMVYDESDELWVCLPTIKEDDVPDQFLMENAYADDNATALAKLRKDAFNINRPHILIYSTTAPNVTLTNEGTLFNGTETQYNYFARRDAFSVLPFNERVRRFLFQLKTTLEVE